MVEPTRNSIARAKYIRSEDPVIEIDDPAWDLATPIWIRSYWSGEGAPAARHAEARIFWSDNHLGVLFRCKQDEPYVINMNPETKHKTLGLWDRDVCEIFVSPGEHDPSRYYEFEAAPTGEWVDLAIDWKEEGRETDWQFRSGMRVRAVMSASAYTVVISIPWKAFGAAPRAGERWRANLFRCVGSDPNRGYLAWQPTRTEVPNFHVPDKFGVLAFTF